MLPATLTSIGTEAFAGCNNLIELEYAEGTRTALRTYATKLTTVTIPGTCSAFADGIFNGCTALTVVNISDLEMWNFIFLGLDKSPFACPHSIYLNGEMLMDLIADFGGPVANYAFANVKGLESVTLTGSISDIQPYAFTNSTELKSVTMGNRVKRIGNNAFAGCTALQSAQLGSGVTSIEASAFEGCSSLNSMRMGGRESSLGSRVFYGCESLQDLKLPTSVNAIGSYAFYNCYNLAKLNIPEGVSTIPAYTFYNCRALEGITLPAGVKQIGTYAFNGCTTLDKIEIPDATTIIGEYAFNGCSKVREARLGAGVTSIGSYAFANCSYLINFYIAAANVPSTNSTAFDGTLASGTSVSEVVLYVPDSSLSAYRAAAPWSSFANILGLANAPVYVTRLTISPEALILEPDGDSGTFTAIPTPANASNTSLTWSTSNAEVATVTKKGIVLTDMEGVATITATAKDGNGARARAVVISTYNFVPVTSVRLDATTLTLTEGDEHHLTATASPSTATYPEVYWTSSNEKVLTVSDDGLLTAIAAGTATITARSADGTGRTATCRVTVNEPTYSSLTTLGDADNDGFVTTSDIQAVTNLLLGNRGGIDRSCDVNNDGHVGIGDVAVVVDALKKGSAVPAGPVKAIKIDAPSKVGKGDSGEICAITVPARSVVNVEWSCSDESILRLDSKKGGVCRFTAIATGRVVVTASYNGQRQNFIIVISSPLTFNVNGVTFNMELVEAGTFQMGSTSGESDETPVHSVTISKDYWMGETEVTQGLWYAVMRQTTSDGWSSIDGLGDDYPAYNISWNDCQTFITKLNAATGQTFRMPTEAEWEYAAKGGNKSQGYTYSGSNNIEDVAWYTSNSGGKTHPVATKQPNELGIYDMSGNVWEWCSDWYSSSYYTSSAVTDPTGPTSGSRRVVRGGSRGSNASGCRTASRDYSTPAGRGLGLGFRLALSPSNTTGGENPSQDPIGENTSQKTFTVNGATFNMIPVEHGTFQMGSDSSDATSKEQPVHSVTISKDYYIGETEVTQALWYAVMGQKPTSDGNKWSSLDGLGDDYPAYYINWDDCQTFITKLNQLTGQTFRMPTEAEWEYAAKGGNKSQGYTYSGSNTIDDVAWYCDNSGYKTHPVATKQPNELGLYDMSGNVWEWCSDWYSSSYYTSFAVTDPTGPTSGSIRVTRGGSCNTDAAYFRTAYRNSAALAHRGTGFGFRLALSPSK